MLNGPTGFRVQEAKQNFSIVFFAIVEHVLRPPVLAAIHQARQAVSLLPRADSRDKISNFIRAR